MTGTTDNGSEPYDPVIAERFRLLDRLEPPPLLEPQAVVRPLQPVAPVPIRRRRPVIMAAAAAVALVAAASAVAMMAGGNGTSGVETVNPAGDGADGTEHMSSSTTSGAGVLEVEPGDDGEAMTTGSTEAPSSTTETTDATGMTPTTSADEGPALTDGSSTLYSFVPQNDSMISVTGIVTEVFTDCQSHLVLGDDGKVHSDGPVSCDGGSWIVINGTRIRTSSGYRASHQAYNRHRSDLQPGDRITVTAIVAAERNKASLDCPLCQIVIDERGAPGQGRVVIDDGGGSTLDPPDKDDTGLDQPGGPGGPADK